MSSHVFVQNVYGTDLVSSPVCIRRKLATPLMKAWKLAILTLAAWIVFIVCVCLSVSVCLCVVQEGPVKDSQANNMFLKFSVDQ